MRGKIFVLCSSHSLTVCAFPSLGIVVVIGWSKKSLNTMFQTLNILIWNLGCHSSPHLCDYFIVLKYCLKCQQYCCSPRPSTRNPFLFLVSSLWEYWPWLFQLSICLCQSSPHVFLISRCPLMCHLASRSSLLYHPHSICCRSVNSTLLVIICKHLAYEVMHYTLANCSFGSVLACRWFFLHGPVLFVCVFGE